MFTFETTDQREVRRFRIAQFNGRTATVRSAGSTITGQRDAALPSRSRLHRRLLLSSKAAERPGRRHRRASHINRQIPV